MKKLLIIIALSLGLILGLNSCGKKSDVKSDSSESHDHQSLDYGNGAYGLIHITDENAISTADFISKLAENNNFEGKVEGLIDAVCQSSGCWVNVKQADGSTFIVKFKEHFSIPKDAAGKRIIFQGTAESEEISIEQLKHFAEDEGLPQEEIDAITESKIKIKFKADGVIIK